jgi:hypothetical protein
LFCGMPCADLGAAVDSFFWRAAGVDSMGHIAPLVILGLSFVFFGWALVALASHQKKKDR